MKYPVLLVEVAVEPRRDDDRKQLVTVLATLGPQAANFACSTDHESGQMILKGADEAELEALVVRLKGEFGLQMNVGAPQVAYRETITQSIEQDTTYKKHLGPMGQFARVRIRFEHMPSGTGFTFQNMAAETAVPSEYLPGVTTGLCRAAQSGVIAGFPMIDFKATLIDGAHHPVDSSVIAFDIAARTCFREATPKAGPRLLEPIMKVEVVTPEQYLGDVIGDLSRRRGEVKGMEARGDAQVVTALVPLASMFGYADDLSKMTRERPYFTMEFDHYKQVPAAVPSDGPFSGAMALRQGAKLA
jgi:elongation factor G